MSEFKIGLMKQDFASRDDDDVSTIVSASTTHQGYQQALKAATEELRIAEEAIIKKRETFEKAKSNLANSAERIRNLGRKL